MIPGLGLVFYILLAYLCGILIHAFLKLCTQCCKNKSYLHKCCKSVTTFLGSLIYWNPLIMFFTEGFLEFCIWSMLGILTFKDASSTMKEMQDVQINSGLSYVTAVLLVAVPVALIILYLKNHDKWTDEKKFQEKYGALLSGAKVDWKENKKSIMLMPSFFYLRRMIFAATCIFMHSFFWGQIAVSILLTKIAMIGIG